MHSTYFFINLKRFDIPHTLGGLCPVDNPVQWLHETMQRLVGLGLGSGTAHKAAIFVPEALVPVAVHALKTFPTAETQALQVGCQGVFGEDVTPGGNFGAFTTFRTAKAMRALGCDWALIGHSEERRALWQLLAAYDPAVYTDPEKNRRAQSVVHHTLRQAVVRAHEAGLRVLFCIGETAEEKGQGKEEEQRAATRAVLHRQLADVFFAPPTNASSSAPPTSALHGLALAYEPLWAIGPGKTPPGQDYIAFAATAVRQVFAQAGHDAPPLVYGGGLKEDNAAAVADAGCNGGFIGLTRFTPPLGFSAEGCAAIVRAYQHKQRHK